jgi:hypothetical protein
VGKDEKETKELANAHDAEKGEEGDGSKAVSRAAHQGRNDAQDEAAKGDPLAKGITEKWTRDRSEKEDVPSRGDGDEKDSDKK